MLNEKQVLVTGASGFIASHLVEQRCGRLFAPRQSARAVIAAIITQALTRDEVRLGSLDPSRDFTFVHDTADGFIRAAQAKNVLGEEINLGNDATITIGELGEKIFKIIGSLGFRVKGAGFGGASVRTHARTPKSGYLPRKFPKSQIILLCGNHTDWF